MKESGSYGSDVTVQTEPFYHHYYYTIEKYSRLSQKLKVKTFCFTAFFNKLLLPFLCCHTLYALILMTD